MSDDLKTDALIEHFILQNALEVGGIDPETGEMIYCITDKMKEVSPKIYAELVDQFEDHMFKIIEQGPIVAKWKIQL